MRKLVDRIITILLFAVTVTVEAVGYSVLAVSGYGWLWGSPLPYGAIVRHPVSHRRMEGFYSGLVVTPIFVSLVVSLTYDQPLVVMIVTGSLTILLLINYYFRKNFFIPILGWICLAIMVAFSCLVRLSIILLFFFLYAFLVFLGPLLLAFFLASI